MTGRAYCDVHSSLQCNGQHRQSEVYGGMTPVALWYWIISHTVSRHEIHEPTEFVFDLYNRKNYQMKKKRESHSRKQFLSLCQFTETKPLECRDGQVSLRKDLENIPKIFYTVSFFPVLPQRDL